MSRLGEMICQFQLEIDDSFLLNSSVFHIVLFMIWNFTSTMKELTLRKQTVKKGRVQKKRVVASRPNMP